MTSDALINVFLNVAENVLNLQYDIFVVNNALLLYLY